MGGLQWDRARVARKFPTRVGKTAWIAIRSPISPGHPHAGGENRVSRGGFSKMGMGGGGRRFVSSLHHRLWKPASEKNGSLVATTSPW